MHLSINKVCVYFFWYGQDLFVPHLKNKVYQICVQILLNVYRFFFVVVLHDEDCWWVYVMMKVLFDLCCTTFPQQLYILFKWEVVNLMRCILSLIDPALSWFSDWIFSSHFDRKHITLKFYSCLVFLFCPYWYAQFRTFSIAHTQILCIWFIFILLLT